MNAEHLKTLKQVKDKVIGWQAEIRDIATEEKADIHYGFRLGKLHSEMWDYWNILTEIEEMVKQEEKTG